MDMRYGVTVSATVVAFCEESLEWRTGLSSSRPSPRHSRFRLPSESS